LRNKNEIFIWTTLILVIINLIVINYYRESRNIIREYHKTMPVPINYQLAYVESSYEGKKFPFNFKQSNEKNIIYVLITGADCNRCLKKINAKLREFEVNKKYVIKYIYFGNRKYINKIKKAENIKYEMIDLASDTHIFEKYFNSHVTPICMLVNQYNKIVYFHIPYFQFPTRTDEFFEKLNLLQED